MTQNQQNQNVCSNSIGAAGLGGSCSTGALTIDTSGIIINTTGTISVGGSGAGLYGGQYINGGYPYGNGIVDQSQTSFPWSITTPTVWGPGGDLSGYWHQNTKPDWMYQNVDKKTLLGYVKDKNYAMMATLGDHTLKRDRKIFSKFENAIKKSNDFVAITSFISQVNNTDLSHLTKHVIASYEASDDKPGLLQLLHNFIMNNSIKLNLKQIISHATKNQKLEFVDWMVGYGFGGADKSSSLREILNIQKISFNKIEKLFLTSTSPASIFSFARMYKTKNKDAFYRLRALGSMDLAKLLMTESDEEWAKALKAMK